MSFEEIPTNVVLKIFDQLPFKDRIRLSGVNRLFRGVSEKSINTMRSLEINDDLMKYSLSTQFFPSLLDSCSPFLESIKVSNQLVRWILNPLTEFVYPKLEHLEIAVTNEELTKKLIRQNRNLRSIVLYLNHNFKWPEDIVMEKLESLAIYSYEDGDEHCVDLSPTLRPLVGNVPNLKHLTIGGPNPYTFNLPVEEFSQLLATTPSIQELQLGCCISNSGNFMAASPTWYLPSLTSLVIDLDVPSSVLHCFPNAFPRLKSFKSEAIEEIDDQAIVALSQLQELRELRLPEFVMIKQKFIEMVTVLPSIAVLEIGHPSKFRQIDDQVVQALSHLQYLRELYLPFVASTKDKIIDLITNVPSLAILKVSKILKVHSPQTLIDFLTSTTALFQRNLEIHLRDMRFSRYDMNFGQMEAILEEMRNNGGPVAEVDGGEISLIRYSP